jgi:hypothetical protein
MEERREEDKGMKICKTLQRVLICNRDFSVQYSEHKMDGGAEIKIMEEPSSKQRANLTAINSEYPVKLRPVKTKSQHCCQTATLFCTTCY